MEEEKIIEKRTNKLLNFFKKNPDAIFWTILILAIILRIYYFTKTLNQPLWWDEAEYMCMSKTWVVSGFEYPYSAVRPVLLPLMAAIFMKLGSTEFLIRLSIFIFSILSLVGTYYFAKEISHNQRVAQIAMLFMSVFYLGLFYTFRILVDIHTLTFYVFAALFFYKYIQTNSNKMLYIGTVIIAIGTLFKLTIATFLFAFLIYLIFTEKWRFLKRKELWISGLIFLSILSPYIIWGYYKFGGFVIAQAGAFNAPDNYLSAGLKNFMFYVNLAPSCLSWALLIFFILGLGYLLLRLILGFDLILKNNSHDLNKQFYLFLVFIVPIIFMCLSVSIAEDRYIIMVFPAVFIICAEFILKVYDFIRRSQKILAVLFLIAILGFSTYSMLLHSNQIIITKQNSYEEVKLAGLWMNQNLDKDSLIISQSLPQIAYYTDMRTKAIPSTEEELSKLLEQENKYANKSYLMLSVFQPHSDWMYNYPAENNLEVVKVYFADAQKTEPILIIYKL